MGEIQVDREIWWCRGESNPRPLSGYENDAARNASFFQILQGLCYLRHWARFHWDRRNLTVANESNQFFHFFEPTNIGTA